MEELSIEEKAKAYDEAIDKIADAVEAGTIEQGFAKWLFPELKESEDERIRKIIKDTLQSYNRGVVLGCLNAKDYSDRRVFNAFTEKESNTDIEYIRKDAFIEKAVEWLDGCIPDYIDLTHANVDTFMNVDNKRFIDEFRKYMEGE